MAELNTSRGQAKGRNPKEAPRVDLTAMVDLAFLLITFFMLTTTLAKQNSMMLAMPVDGPSQPVSEARTITICIGKDDMLQWYAGTMEKPLTSPALTSAAGIRRVLQEQSLRVYTGTGKDLMVLIKPSDKSKYHNLVDLLDEMAVNKISRYAVAAVTQPELDMMKSKRIY
ncbi:biopolymer transporter ExbD [Flavihumibacter sp. R14]|nr:biopolymer transporter ExbD [Flavihumibacter soli]